jgi:hypothetical protein
MKLIVRIARAALVAGFVACGCNVAIADTFVYDFASGFDGWQQQWHENNSPGGSDGVVSQSILGYLDSASLMFDMGNGAGDDGTLWIEKQFAVTPLLQTRVDLAFYLYNLEQSDVNTFQVKAIIRNADPNVQADFTTIGETNSAAGWVPFNYGLDLTSPTGQIWVALGIRVAYESPRDYWIDHVAVSTASVPEPAAGASAIISLAVICCRALRKRNTCSHSEHSR